MTDRLFDDSAKARFGAQLQLHPIWLVLEEWLEEGYDPEAMLQYIRACSIMTAGYYLMSMQRNTV